MKLAIKITLIVLVVAGIAAAVYFFMKPGPVAGEVEGMELTPFEEYITNRVESEIEDHDYDAASQAYVSIVGDIVTEAFATDGNGRRTLSRSSEHRCRREAFNAYAPIFNDYAQSCFRRSEWNENEIDSLRTTARALLADSALESGSTIQRNLQATVTTVNNYHEAWGIVRSANSCTTIDAVNNVTNKAREFQQNDPLRNNTALRTALADAPTKAKNSLTNYITGRCNHLAANYYSYSSYESFTTEYQRLSNLITAYKQRYGTNTLGRETSTLMQADTDAMNYFMGRRNNYNNNNSSRGYRLETDGGRSTRGSGNTRSERREY